jgi:hypothetical protein
MIDKKKVEEAIEVLDRYSKGKVYKKLDTNSVISIAKETGLWGMLNSKYGSRITNTALNRFCRTIRRSVYA